MGQWAREGLLERVEDVQRVPRAEVMVDSMGRRRPWRVVRWWYRRSEVERLAAERER